MNLNYKKIVNYKRFTLIIVAVLFILFYFSMSVSAADHSVVGSDFQSIRDVVNSANSGDRILLGSGTYTGSGSRIVISDDKNLTIQGQSNNNRATLNANNLGGILYVQSDGSATIRYVNFVNGGSSNIGSTTHSLLVSGTILVENCSFINSRGDSGSAIFVGSSASNTIIRNCNFTNNIADNHDDNDYTVGGAICIHGADNVEIRNCYFSGNKALDAGGALAIRNNATNTRVVNCNFLNNQAPDGGAIYNQLSTGIIINGCTFTNNKANNTGGAIYSIDNLNIIDSQFVSNSAKDGGAIYSTSPLRITGSSFNSNTANNNGGTIYSTSTMAISSSSFNKNTAKNNGGGIYNTGNLRLNNITFSSNYANVFSISLKAPSSVNKGDKLVVQSSVRTGDNLFNSIYSENNNVIKNGVSLITSNNTQGKNVILLINDKKYAATTSSKGIATFNIPISSKTTYSSVKLTASFKQKGVTVKAKTSVLLKLKNKVSGLNTTIKNNKYVSSKNERTTLKNKVKTLNKTINKSNIKKSEKNKLISKINKLYKSAEKIKVIKVKTITKAQADKFKKGSVVTSSQTYMEGRVYENQTKTDNRKWIRVSDSATIDQYPLGLRKVTIKTVKNSTGKYVDYVRPKTTTQNYAKTITITNESFIVKDVKGTKNKFLLSNKTTVTTSYSYLANKYLLPSTKCESNSSKIKNLANEIISNYTKQYIKEFNIPQGVTVSVSTNLKADLIYMWVCNNVDYVSNANYSAIGVLNESHKNGNGKYIANCVGYSNLMTALLRSIDIPVKYHSILYFENDSYPFIGPHKGHVWAEVYLGNWVFADGAFFYKLASEGRGIGTYIPGFHDDNYAHIAFNYTHDNRCEIWELDCNHYLNSSHKDSNILFVENKTGILREPYIFFISDYIIGSGVMAVDLMKNFNESFKEVHNKSVSDTFIHVYRENPAYPGQWINMWYIHIYEAIKIAGDVYIQGSFLGYIMVGENGILYQGLNDTTPNLSNGSFITG